MSRDAVTWAWKQRKRAPSAAALLVLVQLADQARDSGKVWPSHAYLATQIPLSARTIRTAIAALETAGLLRTEPRHGKSDVIWLNFTPTMIFESIPDDEDFEGGQGRGRPRKTSANSAPTSANSAPTSAAFADKPIIEPTDRTIVVCETRARPFDQWWARYPLKKAKDAAIVAFEKAMRRIEDPDPLAVLIAGADRYVEEIARTGVLVKHPATWLNGGCWNDEPDANGGLQNGRGSPASTGRVDRGLEQHRERVAAMQRGAMEALNRRRGWGIGNPFGGDQPDTSGGTGPGGAIPDWSADPGGPGEPDA